MHVRVGFMGIAHLHAASYAHSFKALGGASVTGIWDPDASRGRAFASEYGLTPLESAHALLESCDAVVIASENSRHAELGMQALEAGRHVLCEKPLVIDLKAGRRLVDLAKSKGLVLMTAFPCPYSPAFHRLQDRLRKGEIGKLRAICSTNRGTCPMGWFVEKQWSGGGAMIDHTVHVADLLWRLVGKEPVRVHAQVANKIYGQDWEDSAMLTLEYPGGVFATLDSSWSRPKSYKTWGDVTMRVIGDAGLLDLDMFNQSVETYRNDASPAGRLSGYGSNLDMAIAQEFLRAIGKGDQKPLTSGEDGLRAAAVALTAYASLESGLPTRLQAA
ncbi:MAG: Myo-inositol 2-dehydrogenase [Fimbriimonadaceae bacterium]|nr:Myo-inositol 2-dehydrogenase [Fimbriimonadaceae bacterium]